MATTADDRYPSTARTYDCISDGVFDTRSGMMIEKWKFVLVASFASLDENHLSRVVVCVLK